MTMKNLSTLAWAAPAVAFCSIWALERSFSFSRPLDELAKANDVWAVPNYNNGTLWADVSEALKGAYSNWFGPERFWAIRIHVWTSTIMSLIVIAGLWFGDEIRAHRQAGKKHPYADVHKKLGWVCFYVGIVNQIDIFYTIYIIGMLPFGTAAYVVDSVGFWGVMVSAPLGIWFATTKKDFWSHKICMIWLAASLFHIPLQRCIWFTLNKFFLSAEFYEESPGVFFTFVDKTIYVAGTADISMALFYTYLTLKEKKALSAAKKTKSN